MRQAGNEPRRPAVTSPDQAHASPSLGRARDRGFTPPTEKNPTRVLPTDAEYQAMREVDGEIDSRFRVARVLAHETGHRIGTIRQLRCLTSI